MVCMACMVVIAGVTRRLSWWMHGLLFCVGYFGQDLAHYCSGEPTMQSSYQQDDTFWEQLLEHTYYLIPLIFDALLPASSPARVQPPLLVPSTPIGRKGELVASLVAGGAASVLWAVSSTRPQKATRQT